MRNNVTNKFERFVKFFMGQKLDLLWPLSNFQKSNGFFWWAKINYYSVGIVVSSVLGGSRILGVCTFALQRRVDNSWVWLVLVTGQTSSKQVKIAQLTMRNNYLFILAYCFERFIKFFMSQKLDLLCLPNFQKSTTHRWIFNPAI